MLNGHPIARFQLSKSGGRWVITGEQRLGAPAPSTTTTASAPSPARVSAVARCLEKTFGVEDAGSDSTGGVPHVVLALDIDRRSAAMVDVFASAAAASAGYPGVKAGSGSLTAKLSGGLVIVYLKPVPAPRQSEIERCA
jgi:hypothetical protein